MSDQLKERCAECRFIEKRGDGYFCRRYPPTAFLVQTQQKIALAANQGPQMGAMGEYPPVLRSGWCGEYQRKMEGTA